MKRYGNFFDQLVSFENLLLAAKKRFEGKRIGNQLLHFILTLKMNSSN